MQVQQTGTHNVQNLTLFSFPRQNNPQVAHFEASPQGEDLKGDRAAREPLPQECCPVLQAL